MARQYNKDEFNELYERYICHEAIQPNARAYYRRYRSRYKLCIDRFAQIAPPGPIDVLDIGVGQLALLCKKLWNDRAVVADLPGNHLSYIASHGVETVHWNICKSEPPFFGKFDVVFFSEVIEHLPIPGHVALERLRKTLRPGGFIICTTPNLYRLRNVLCMAAGLPIFDYFRIPDDDKGISHWIEYSRDHLQWQFDKSGFTQCRVEYSQMHHLPHNPLLRPLALLGYPLHILPRWRDSLIATAYAPAENKSGDTR
jgi:2-polyprenyl-3-methyl-5-hydroxy-6-metoxy-1,4-benzoquinol methylase